MINVRKIMRIENGAIPDDFTWVPWKDENMKKVLVVDDCLMSQELISDWLIKSYAIEVLLACDVPGALSCLNNNIIDFVICDYEMPGGNGLLVLNYLRENMFHIPFVLFSGRYDLKVDLGFPLVEFINDKSYDKLFKFIQGQQVFLIL